MHIRDENLHRTGKPKEPPSWLLLHFWWRKCEEANATPLTDIYRRVLRKGSLSLHFTKIKSGHHPEDSYKDSLDSKQPFVGIQASAARDEGPVCLVGTGLPPTVQPLASA